jgi:nicotinamidase-related amidase
MTSIAGDPLGPYGEVLRRAPRPVAGADDGLRRCGASGAEAAAASVLGGDTSVALQSHLDAALGREALEDYRGLLRTLDQPAIRVRPDRGALLIIDPQSSFTSGVWARSAGAGAASDVQPLRLAFARCGQVMASAGSEVDVVLTRCPFPPDSYDWDESVARALPTDQIYLVKPGNSALWPPTNGFAEWVDSLLARGKRTLVVAGCTLNSCVRVTAIETQHGFGERGLQVVVDLSACGARTTNFDRSPAYGGRSSVRSAVLQMGAAGVALAETVIWG